MLAVHVRVSLCVSAVQVYQYFYAFVDQDKVDINQPDKNGKTPLMLANGRKHRNIIDYLKNEAKSRSQLIPRIDFW